LLPLVEDFLKSCVEQRIAWLKKHPDKVTEIFGVLGRRSSMNNFKSYLANTDFKVLLGFPREPSQLPCYVITLAGEHEIPTGLGDSIDEDLCEDTEDEYGDYRINVSYMESNYRIEAWTDNADLAVYMYIIAKWAMFVSRHEMLEAGFVIPNISGADLEPAPDYFPQFIYRRALMISFQYENQYYETEEEIETYDDMKVIPHLYSEDVTAASNKSDIT
jgi:hypothetical protein